MQLSLMECLGSPPESDAEVSVSAQTLAGGGLVRRYMQANSVPAHLGNLYRLAVLGERQGSARPDTFSEELKTKWKEVQQNTARQAGGPLGPAGGALESSID
ncbi:hypothetical protein VC83_02427 [Pseudogymnoascus destructans]|uniref:Uncharacterized protein n=1 Tax=Pseudogymnoascus destructans TaxID=655981 RepID=A0A177AFY2_9PEZI|nr:uncharacterized protein VC83_02427 [Pseudogymnoascus destructans]OAF61018.1 hypothetical protein VC83_02427 [Pseudogymnoascus destructans]